ncbi:site-specific integrase [Planktomarina temperata]|nr:site-specific integrase [Planktomarina temperata]
MTDPTVDPNPFADLTVISLATLKERVEEDRSVELLRRREICSAITTVAKWLNMPPEMIPAAMSYLRPRLGGLHPIQLGVSDRRIQNVRSLLLSAFRIAGISTKLAPYTAKMSPAWQQLWDLMEGDRYGRTELSRLFRYCSANGIVPSDLSDVISSDFLTALEAESLIKKPKVRHQSVCRVWNQQAGNHAGSGWPQIELTIPKYDNRLYGVDESLVSDAIKDDLAGYLAHLAGADLFGSMSKPFRPKSVEIFRGHFWRYLSALHHSGVGIADVNALDELVVPAMFERALRWLYERNGKKTSKHIGEIAWAVRCYAVKYRTCDDETLAFYKRAIERLRVNTPGLSDKNRTAMAQFNDPKAVTRYVALPSTLWSKAVAIGMTVEGRNKRKEAQLMVQAAVAIEIAMFAPIRIQNLSTIRLDQHISWNANRLRLSFPAHEVKNDQALDFLLPVDASERIKRYINEWRSLFMPATNPHLFPGRNGKPKDQSALRNQMKKAIFDHTGLQMTPHQFRHAAAKLLLDAKPGHYEVVRKLLGHKTLTTTYAHYAGAETDAAIELYDDIILQLRRPAPVRSETEASNQRTRSQKGKPRRLTATPKEPPFMDPLTLLGQKRGK